MLLRSITVYYYFLLISFLKTMKYKQGFFFEQQTLNNLTFFENLFGLEKLILYIHTNIFPFKKN